MPKKDILDCLKKLSEPLFTNILSQDKYQEDNLDTPENKNVQNIIDRLFPTIFSDFTYFDVDRLHKSLTRCYIEICEMDSIAKRNLEAEIDNEQLYDLWLMRVVQFYLSCIDVGLKQNIHHPCSLLTKALKALSQINRLSDSYRQACYHVGRFYANQISSQSINSREDFIAYKTALEYFHECAKCPEFQEEEFDKISAYEPNQNLLHDFIMWISLELDNCKQKYPDASSKGIPASTPYNLALINTDLQSMLPEAKVVANKYRLKASAKRDLLAILNQFELWHESRMYLFVLGIYGGAGREIVKTKLAAVEAFRMALKNGLNDLDTFKKHMAVLENDRGFVKLFNDCLKSRNLKHYVSIEVETFSQFLNVFVIDALSHSSPKNTAWIRERRRSFNGISNIVVEPLKPPKMKYLVPNQTSFV